MKFKYVRTINDRVTDIYEFEGKNKKEATDKFEQYISKRFHNDYINYFTCFPGSTKISFNDVKKGKKFIPYVESEEKRQQKKSRITKQKIKHHQQDAIDLLMDYVLSKDDAPQELKDLKNKINKEGEA